MSEVSPQRGLGAHLDDGLLVAYLQGAPDRRQDIEAHLTQCADCRALLVELGEPVPPGLLRWAVGATTPRLPRRVWPLALAPALAAALALFMLRAREEGPPEYLLEGPGGGVALSRGTGEATAYFVPQSQLSWRFLSRRPPPAAAIEVYVELPGGRWEQASAGELERGDGGLWRYQVQAERLLGADFGTRSVHFALLPEVAAHRPLAGTKAEVQAQLGDRVRWLSSELDYRRSAPAEEP